MCENQGVASSALTHLGLMEHPATGTRQVDLRSAQQSIGMLAMLREKTRGNLTNEESAVLRSAVSNLQMAFVEASQAGKPGETARPLQPNAEPSSAASAEAAQSSPETASPAPAETESKKKFTKSYGS